MTSKSLTLPDNSAPHISRNITKTPRKKDLSPSDLSPRRRDKGDENDLNQYNNQVKLPIMLQRLLDRPKSRLLEKDQPTPESKKVSNSQVEEKVISQSGIQTEFTDIKRKASSAKRCHPYNSKGVSVNQFSNVEDSMKTGGLELDRKSSIKPPKERKRTLQKVNLVESLKKRLSLNTPNENINIIIPASSNFRTERALSTYEEARPLSSEPPSKERIFKKSCIVRSITLRTPTGSNMSIESKTSGSSQASSMMSFQADSDVSEQDDLNIREQEKHGFGNSRNNSNIELEKRDNSATNLKSLRISLKEKKKILRDSIHKRKSISVSVAHQSEWLKVYRTMKLSLKLIKKFKICELWADNIVKIPLSDNGNMSFIMKMYKSEADNNLSKKMATLLSRNTIRTRDAINELDKILKYRLPSYASFSLEKRRKLCKIMQYESYPEGKLICKESQRAENFYFILSGKIEIFLIKENARTRVNVMNFGESIGRIQLVNDIRMASIATLVPTEFLCINKREFASVQSHAISPEEIDEQVNALCSLSSFANNKTFLENSRGCFEITVYSIGDVILKEGEMTDRFYFILNGSCRCTKAIPFLAKKTTSGKELSVYDPSKPLDAQEEIVEYVLDFQLLETSDHFPGIPPEANRIKEILEVDSVRAHSMLRGYIGNSKEDEIYLCQYSVIATSKSEIASISKIDYITHATKAMIAENLMQKNMYHFSTKEVQEAFIIQQKWESYKKSQRN